MGGERFVIRLLPAASRGVANCSRSIDGHQCRVVRRMANCAARESESISSGENMVQGRGERGGGRGMIGRRGSYSPFGMFDLMDSFFPSRNLRQMVESFDRLFEDPGFSPYRDRYAGPRSKWRSHIDLSDTDQAFRMRVDLPGLSKEEVKVFVEDGSLVIKGEPNEEKKAYADEFESRSYDSYSIRFLIPDDVKVEDIKAEVKDGVLNITIPKAPEVVKNNKIDINVS